MDHYNLIVQDFVFPKLVSREIALERAEAVKNLFDGREICIHNVSLDTFFYPFTSHKYRVRIFDSGCFITSEFLSLSKARKWYRRFHQGTSPGWIRNMSSLKYMKL